MRFDSNSNFIFYIFNHATDVVLWIKLLHTLHRRPTDDITHNEIGSHVHVGEGEDGHRIRQLHSVVHGSSQCKL